MLVILEEKSYLFSLNRQSEVYKDPYLITKFNTCLNPTAVGWLISRKERNVAIVPDQKENRVQIYDSVNTDSIHIFEIKETPSIITANLYGDVFAVADSKGLSIKIYNLNDGSFLNEYSRGIDSAQINWIAFEKYWRRMAVTSNKETVHCFTLPKEWSEQIIDGIASFTFSSLFF